MYRGVNIRLYHRLDPSRLVPTLQRLRDAGANAVAFVPHQYCILRMDPANPKHDALPVPAPLATHPDQYIFADLDEGGAGGMGLVGNTTPLADVREACRQAAGLGLAVLLKPHVDPLYWHAGERRYYAAGWRGNISLGDAAAFGRSYCADFLGPYAGIATELQLPLLTIGVEYVQITRDQGPGFWTGVADWVARQGYGGTLTYAANWGWGSDAEFARLAPLWQHPRVGFVGVDAYFPLWPIQLTEPMLASGWSPAPGTPEAEPTTEQLVAGWTQPHLMPNGKPLDVAPVAALQAVSQAAGKPLLFTEIGYSNRLGANWDPGRDPTGDEVTNPKGYLDDPTHPGCLQERCSEAFKQVWGMQDSFGGFFWWDASLDPAQDPRQVITHNILSPRDLSGADGTVRIYYVLGTRLESALFKGEKSPAPQPALTLRAAPRITAPAFAGVLQTNGSPVVGEAPPQAYYDLCVRYNVDPALALAFFALESDYGTRPPASTLRNWGMLWDTRTNRPAAYPTWMAGLEDWLKRVQGPAYIKTGEPTLTTMVPIYRPSGLQQFGGDPSKYAGAAAALVRDWQGSAPPPPAPAPGGKTVIAT